MQTLVFQCNVQKNYSIDSYKRGCLKTTPFCNPSNFTYT